MSYYDSTYAAQQSDMTPCPEYDTTSGGAGRGAAHEDSQAAPGPVLDIARRAGDIPVPAPGSAVADDPPQYADDPPEYTESHSTTLPPMSPVLTTQLCQQGTNTANGNEIGWYVVTRGLKVGVFQHW